MLSLFRSRYLYQIIFISFLVIGSILLGFSNSFIFHKQSNIPTERKIINRVAKQLNNMPEEVNKKTGTLKYPRSLSNEGTVYFVNKGDWTSGFYSGILWLMYDLTSDSNFKEKAKMYTNALESEQFNSSSHDIGFKMMSSFGLGFKLTQNKVYKDVLTQSAKTLISRFDEKIGCIRSWDHNQDKWQFPVIIDNLMNLELLYWAWKQTGDSVYLNIANTHAKTTIKNHFRHDYSTYHVVNYDTITGTVINKSTHQGYADESCWSRGEAWALYGYTMAYRESKNPEFLRQAENIADYIINIAGLPSDFIPFWDYAFKEGQKEPRDASAAAIMASAFYELSSFETQKSKTYLKTANHMMASLSSDTYFNKEGTHNGFLLGHSTGSKPQNSEVDVPLVYADYYYLEALSRKLKLNNN